MSDAISKDFLFFQNCHRQQQRHVFTLWSPVDMPLKYLGIF